MMISRKPDVPQSNVYQFFSQMPKSSPPSANVQPSCSLGSLSPMSYRGPSFIVTLQEH